MTSARRRHHQQYLQPTVRSASAPNRLLVLWCLLHLRTTLSSICHCRRTTASLRVHRPCCRHCSRQSLQPLRHRHQLVEQRHLNYLSYLQNHADARAVEVKVMTSRCPRSSHVYSLIIADNSKMTVRLMCWVGQLDCIVKTSLHTMTATAMTATKNTTTNHDTDALVMTPRPCNDYSCYGALEIVGAITINDGSVTFYDGGRT